MSMSSQSVYVSGMDPRTMIGLAEMIGRQVPVSPCFAGELHVPLDAIDTSVRTTAASNEERLVALMQLLASPGACQAAEHYRWGWRAANHDRWSEAVTEFQAAIDAHPYDAQSHLALGLAFQTCERHQDAVEPLKRAVIEGTISDHAIALRAVIMLTEILDQLGRPDEATATLSDAIEQLPHCVEVVSLGTSRDNRTQFIERLAANSPKWLYDNAPDLIDAALLPLNQGEAQARVNNAIEAAQALAPHATADQPADGTWTSPLLNQVAEQLLAIVDDALSADPLDEQITAAQAEISSAEASLAALQEERVAFRERKGHKRQISDQESAVRETEQRLTKLQKDRAARQDTLIPRFQLAHQSLQDVPLADDEPSARPAPEGMEGLVPRPLT